MKIKLDENLPERLVPALTALGHDIDTVWVERLNGQADPNVWKATQAAQRFFITQVRIPPIVISPSTPS